MMKHRYFPILFISFISIALISFSYNTTTDDDLKIHECGTFTTLYDSEGNQLSGLYLEDEPLPDFIYKHAYPTLITDRLKKDKGPFIEPLNITMKMEYPTIYFYNNKPMEASIDIGFNVGTISQWYPKRDGGDELPSGNEVDFSKPFDGLTSWNTIEVLEPYSSEKYSLDKTNLEACRETEANKIKIEDEIEGFLFYQGIGSYKSKLDFKFNSDHEISVTNNTDADIPYLFVYDKSDDSADVWWTGGLKKGETITAKATSSSISYVNAKLKEFQKALRNEGLYSSEAEAMLKVGEKSFFKKNGFRLFYILPKNEIEKLLPINVIPQPKELKRVYVSRCDILKPAFEKEIKRLYQSNSELELYKNHRYYLGIKKRAKGLNN